MYSPCEVNAKERLLILGQLWGRKTKFDPNANSYKCLIFYKIGLSPYLCVVTRARKEAKMTPIIAFASYKGGVGKTTACLNMGGVLAMGGHKVCLIDLDPQTNLSTAFNVTISSDKLGVRFLLADAGYNLKE